MQRAQPIRTRPGRKPGELIVTLPPGWELRLRRVLREMMGDALPNPRERGLTPQQRAARLRERQRRIREAMCHFLSELLTADIVGKEVALSSRSRLGARSGSLREHVQALLREIGVVRPVPPKGRRAL
ncbi:hypothetical protein KF840_26485 [bacterium]|nr:hypothetical protein [bacterium]